MAAGKIGKAAVWLREALAPIGALLFIALAILLYPLLIVMMYFSYWLRYRASVGAQTTDTGIDVVSPRHGRVASYRWNEIRAMRLRRRPPITVPELILGNGTVVALENADRHTLADALRKRNIPVDMRESMED